MKRARVEDLAGVFQAFGDATRLRLLNLLLNSSELCVDDMVRVLRESQPKVSRHLAYLRRSGLVRDRKEGLWVYYRIADLDEPLYVAFDLLRSALDDISLLERDLHTLASLAEPPPSSAGEDLPRQRTELEVELL